MSESHPDQEVRLVAITRADFDALRYDVKSDAVADRLEDAYESGITAEAAERAATTLDTLASNASHGRPCHPDDYEAVCDNLLSIARWLRSAFEDSP